MAKVKVTNETETEREREKRGQVGKSNAETFDFSQLTRESAAARKRLILFASMMDRLVEI